VWSVQCAKDIVVWSAEKWSKKKALHIRRSALYMEILTMCCIAMVFLDWMHFHILLHIVYLMHSTSPCISCYSSIELGNGLIDHFLVCLDNGDIEALESYQYELGSDFLHELHGICDINIYLSKMHCLHLQM
jgi:hypothetical protein